MFREDWVLGFLHRQCFKLVVIISLTALLPLAACQTGSSTKMSLDEAKRLAVVLDDRSTDFVPPPRTVDDLRKLIGSPPPIPDNCNEIRQVRAQDGELLVARIQGKGRRTARLAGTLSVLVENQFSHGNFKQTIELLNTAHGQMLQDENNEIKALFLADIARIKATIGDIPGARAHLSEALKVWDITSQSNEYVLYQRNFYEAMDSAVIAQNNGELPAAEIHYRRALRIGGGGGVDTYIYKDRMSAELVANLIQQGRLVEAELEARKAVKSVFRKVNPRDRFTAQSALPVSELSVVLLEQGRLDDAGFVARIAVGMHKIDCSLPESLAFVRARQVLAKVLAAKGDWPGVLDQMEAVQSALTDRQAFEHLFGDNVEWAQALVHTGRVSEGLRKFRAALERTIERKGSDSYEAAEVRGLLAMAQAAVGNQKAAFGEFTSSLPALVGGRDQLARTTGQTTRNYRAIRIIDSYIDFLTNLHGESIESAGGINVIDELFRVASVAHLGNVQRALSSAAVRSTPNDPELADLMRREQDAAQENNAALNALSFLEYAPIDQIDIDMKSRLRERLIRLRKARNILLGEIRNRFPDFSHLMASQPISLVNIQSELSPNEAMLFTYSTKSGTYVWAIPRNGEISFAAIEMGQEELAEKVALLRSSLDPGNVATIGDIPVFDVDAAYDLYEKLLKPVESGWKSAKSLLVIADGPLGQLPLSLLPTKPVKLGPEKAPLFANYRDVPWLARTHAVTVLPSVASLKTLRRTMIAGGGRRPFAGFGDPYFSKSQELAAAQKAEPVQVASAAGATRGLPITLRNKPQTRGVDSATLALLPRLPDTRTEINAIAEALGADPSRDVFLGAKASEGQVKAMDLTPYKVISFATHGLVPGDLNGLTQPALAFSNPQVTGDEEDGLLTMGEILGLKLNADWVVLSACNTASADGAGAEAVSGLGLAFFYAGTRALLVSNWPVHSAATTELTTELFRRQAADKTLSRAEALRRTRVHLIDGAGFKDAEGRTAFSYAHPIFWAPFIVVGDGGGGRAPSS